MSTVRLGINGFGRIGRLTFRSTFAANKGVGKVMAINDPFQDNEYIAYLLKYDSVHGRFPGEVRIIDDKIHVGQGLIEMQATYNADELNWEGIDVLLECTGAHNSKEASMIHLEKGAKRVLLSAPGKNADKTVVYGVNHDQMTSEDLIVSNASCTTNCLAPLAKALNDSVGIESGIMTTVHSYTGDQPTLDKKHKDLYRARAAAMSMIPTSTGAAKAVGLVLPELEGRLHGSAIRVPTPNVSCVDLTFTSLKETSVEAVNEAIRHCAEGSMKGVLAYDPEPKVSIDFNHDPHSSIFAPAQTQVTDGRLVRVLSWYDNEWGFSCRMADTAVAMGKLI